jgi:hypothetical protein
MVERDVQPSSPQGQLVCRSPGFAGRARGDAVRPFLKFGPCNNIGGKMMCLSNSAQNQNCDRAVMMRFPVVRRSAA